MDFSAVSFGGVPEEILGGYNGASPYADENSPYRELFSNCDDAYVEPQDEFHPGAEGEFHMGGEYQESHSVIVDGGDRYGVSSVFVDRKEELVWMGNSGGHVTSYFSTNMMKYTSYQVHATEEIRDLRTIDAGLLTMTPTSLHMRTRQGIPVFSHRSAQLENMQCMLQMGNFPHRLLLGGHQSGLVEFDLARQELLKVYDVGEPGCVILRDHPRFVCHGDMSGRIVLHDPRTLREEHYFQAHSGSLSDFDVQGNYIVTCGFSQRMGQMMGDQFVMVYDMRMMKLSLPLRCMIPPFFLRFVPGLSSCLTVVSLVGQWQMMDAAQPDAIMSMSYQLSCSPESVVTSFDIASSSQALVFGDNMGSLYLYTTGNKPVFNNFSQETIMPDIMEQTKTIPLTDTTSTLASIHMYYPNGPLLSDWPAKYMRTSYRPTPPIDPQILQSVKLVGSIGYAPNVQNRRRNQVPYKFSQNRGPQSVTNEAPNAKNEDGVIVHVPRRYRKIEIKYTKLGMDEIDYDQYNRTSFSGLDMALPNSYCNSMVQVFYYIQPLRARLLSHLCDREFCLACELGFLFHMLDISVCQGVPCHASNFLRAFRTIPEASAMSLTLSDQDNRAKINLSTKIQSWNRFVLQQIHTETMEDTIPCDVTSSGPGIPTSEGLQEEGEGEKLNYRYLDKREFSPVSDIFGAHVVNINRCTRCSFEIRKDVTSMLVNLVFPDTSGDYPGERVPFSQVLERSMCIEHTTQAWCDACGKYQPIEQSRQYKSLPNALSINFSLDNPQDNKFWRTQLEILLRNAQEKLIMEAKEEEENEEALEDSEKLLDNSAYSSNQTSAVPQQASLTPQKVYTPQTPQTPQTSQTPQAVQTPQTPQTSYTPQSSHTPQTPYTPQQLSYTPQQPTPSGSMTPGTPVKKADGVVKPCRYGQACNRPDCRFWHPGQDRIDAYSSLTGGNILSLLDQTMEFSWVPLCIRAKLQEDGTVSISDIDKEEIDFARDDEDGIVYELVGVVSHVSDPRYPDKNNLVACIKVGPSYHARAKVSSVAHWYLFNDISIQPVAMEEAVWFPIGWKVPCVLYWVRRELPKHLHDLQPVNPITADVFKEDKSLAQRGKKRITFTPLTSDEMPGEGDLVPMDAEFVNLHQEEAEIRSDGTRTTIKPSHKSVARITCLRGHGPLEGKPFLDDYISTQEQVVDYLTQFSGIKPGDLDAHFSQKHLTTLKSTYIKLRYLADKGVKFVGHGLKNDFRVINMVVPQSQLIDTVHLFHLPHHRMVSLKFLAWYFLKLKIQSITHDSIEDARTAHALYQKYILLKKENNIVIELQQLYETGKKVQWKVLGEEEEECT